METKKCTTFLEATAQYIKYTGNVLELADMFAMYCRYRNVSEYFDGFIDWLIYH